MVIDTDGSTFITKAEFDSLKNNFQAQIDNYNNSIDSKIDGAIAAYLAGVWVGQNLNIYIGNDKSVIFKNDMSNSRCKKDEGLIDLTHLRINRTYGLMRNTTGSKTWHTVKKYAYIWYEAASDPGYNFTCYDLLTSSSYKKQWKCSYTQPEDKCPFGMLKFITLPGMNQWADIRVDSSDTSVILADFLGVAANMFSSITWVDKMRGCVPSIYFAVAAACLKQGNYTYIGLDSGTVMSVQGNATDSGPASPIPDYRTDSDLSTYSDDTRFGVGYGVNTRSGVRYLNTFYKQISILNNYQFQEYSYYKKDSDTYYKNSDGWTVSTGTVGYKQFEPELLWTRQEHGTKRNIDSTETNNTTYVSYLMSQLKIEEPEMWNDYCQLGTNTWSSNIRCFDESCVRQISTEITLPGSSFTYNVKGFYIDASGNFKENPNCYIQSGDVKYKSMSWASEEPDIKEVAQNYFSNISGDIVFLGGGVPLCQTPAETNGSKVKLHYKLTKLDGTPIDAAAGDIPIKITLSNKQFVNGNLASGAANRGELTATANSTSPEGDWTSGAFQMAAKEKLWLNAYASTKGYNVVISNIDVN